MKRFSFLLIIVFFLSCSRGWKNPLESDEELKHQPEIEQITLDAQYNIVLYLSSGYSEKSNIILERKTKGGFESISYVRLSQATLVDTTFDKELDYNFAYRVRVEKNGYRTDYSTEKSFDYVSKILNAPTGLQATTLELQGIKLEWRDRSSKETGYKIEKNQGSGYVEIASSLPANSQSYIDAIAGIPPLPLQLSYRVKAVNSVLASQWVMIGTTYAGIGVPNNLRITDTTFYQFTIEWSDNSNIETGYSVERNKNGGEFREIAQLNANAIRYSDRIANAGVYGYRVRARKDNLYSSYSSVVSRDVKIVLPTEGLVAYYPFNGNANDESGNGHNGNVNGAVLTIDRFGNGARAYLFDGNNDYIEVPDDNALKPPVITGSVWVKVNSYSSIRMGDCPVEFVIFKRNTRYYQFEGYYLIISDSKRFGGGSSSASGVQRGVDSMNETKLNQWYHLVFVSDSRRIKLYLDGVLQGTVDTNFNLDYGNRPLFFGSSGESFFNGFFNGIIDDVRIYNRALTEFEIQALYHEGGW